MRSHVSPDAHLGTMKDTLFDRPSYPAATGTVEVRFRTGWKTLPPVSVLGCPPKSIGLVSP